jgi:hypothetical protein
MVNIERLLNSPAPMRQAIRHLIRSTGLGSWRFQYKTWFTRRRNLRRNSASQG